MKFVILLIVALGAIAPALGQTEKYYFRSSDKIVKLNISEVFSLIPTFGIEVESQFKEKSALLFGVGIIPSFFQPLVGTQSNFTNGGFNNFNAFNGYDYLGGYQFAFGGRFYAFKKSTRYVSFGAHFRHLIIRDKDVLYGVEPIGEVNQWNAQQFNYNQIVDMLFHQFRVSWVGKVGFQRNVGSHFVLDFNLGARLETTAVQTRSEAPEDGTLIRTWNMRLTLQDNYKSTRIMPVMGFKIGYRL